MRRGRDPDDDGIACDPKRERAPGKVGISRVYDKADRTAARVILVDRLWPRGVARSDAPFGMWLKDVAPSTELRKWYGHLPERFDEFALRYRRELSREPARSCLVRLRELARGGEVILATATKDLDHSGAAVLRDVLEGN